MKFIDKEHEKFSNLYVPYFYKGIKIRYLEYTRENIKYLEMKDRWKNE